MGSAEAGVSRITAPSYNREMFLLPVGHQESVVRRLPWVSVGILATCIAMQIYASAVESDLERKATVLLRERTSIEKRLIEEHLAHKPSKDKNADLEKLLNQFTNGIDPQALKEHFADDPDDDLLAKLKAGELTEHDDPRYVRYLEVDDELSTIEAKLPVVRFGYKPTEGGLLHMLTSMFSHIGWLHLIGNMWFLYLVGCNLEDRWGRWQFLTFYVVAGCIAARMFGVLHAGSTQPLVGASGAVAGAMGAFMVCYARTRVKIFYAYILFFRPRWGTFTAPTWVVLGLWMLEQVAMAVLETWAGSPVAYSAHAAGFAFGAIVAVLLRASGIDSALDHASEHRAHGSAWNEHPTYLQALEARDRRDHVAARRLLLELLLEAPEHVGAHEALIDTYFDSTTSTEDVHDVDLSLPFLIDHYHRLKLHDAQIALYRRLRRTLPSYGLTDQELLRIASAAHQQREVAVLINAASEMIEEHPRSAALPRVLLLVAEAQGRSGSIDLQRDTLRRITDRFPDHACAKLALDELARLPT